MRRFFFISLMLVAFLSLGCSTTRYVTRSVNNGVTTVDSMVTRSVWIPPTTVDVDHVGGVRIGSSFRRQAVRMYDSYCGPKLVWHTFAGGIETSPRSISMTSHNDRARFTIVGNCHPSRIVLYRDGIEYRTLRARQFSFEVPNDWDNATRTYTLEVLCEGNEIPWTWDFDVESSSPRMRGSYP